MERKEHNIKQDINSVKILKNLKKAAIPIDALLFEDEVELGKLVKLVPGGVILFNSRETDLAQLRVQGVPFATGQVVKVGDSYGLQVVEILSDRSE